MVKLTFLGTGAAEGIPSPFCDCGTCEHARRYGGVHIRKRQSVLVNDDLLIDMGPDVPAACAMYGISLAGLKYNLITHSHEDHFYRHNLMMRGKGFRRKSTICPLELIAGGSVFRMLGQANDESLDITRRTVEPGQLFELPPYRIKSIPAAHHEASGDAMNYIIGDGDVNVLYACDTGVYKEEAWRHLEGYRLDAILIDSTTTQTDHQKVHLNYTGVLSILERMSRIGAKTENTRVYVTHFSHQANPPHDELVQLYRPSGIQVAYDGMVISI